MVLFCSCWGARDDAVVRALASHQCGPGLNPGVDAICGLSLSLVLSRAPRGFSPGTRVFPSPQKPTFPNSNSTRNHADRRRTTLWMCYLQITIYFIYFILFLKKAHCSQGKSPQPLKTALLWLWQKYAELLTLHWSFNCCWEVWFRLEGPAMRAAATSCVAWPAASFAAA